MGKLVDAFDKAAKQLRKREDILELEYDDKLPFIKTTSKEGKITEVRQVSEDYVLEENEKKATKEEFLKYQNKVMKEYFKKKINVEEDKKKILKITNYIDNTELFWKHQPFFYDNSGIFWFWKDNKYEQVDDTDVMNMLDDTLEFGGQTVNSKLKSHYLEAFKRVGRKHKPKDAPSKWIQFNKLAYSITSKKIYTVEPNYFFCNPIPWEIGKKEDTPIMDKLFKEWVGEKNITKLHELVAYCCYTDYPIQLLFCLVGSGRNGKGCFLKILDNFLGGDINVTSTSLDLISGNNKSRFESFRLYKKLVALMGETNFGLLTNTSLLKQLTGGDKIGFEKKGKDPFTGYNYAKIIIASNSLPTTQDTSDGFFRRWLIIDFPNEFPEGKDITRIIPEIEYNNLARKVINILPKLIERGSFTNQGEIEERRKKYIYASNPLPLFLKQCCILNDEEDTFISSAELYTAYIYYLKKHKKRRVKNKEFKVALEDEGFWADKTSKKVGITDEGYAKNKVTYWIDGIILVSDWKGRVLDSFAPFANNPTPLPTIEELKWEIGQKEQNTQQTEQIEQTIHHRCSICNANESHYWADNGKPICRDCYGAKSAQKGLK